VHVTVDGDFMSAITGAFAGGPGIIVSAGTGSFAFGRTESGQHVRVGGWGYLVGDEGSGFALARQAVNAALQDWDGRGEPTALRGVFERHFQVESIELIIGKIYQPGFDRGHMAKLAPLVFAAAENGDAVAQRLIAQTGFELGRHALAVLKKFESRQKISLVLLGGLFRRRDMLLPAFWQALECEKDRLQLAEPRFPPVIGAALLAVLQAGHVLNEAFLANLEKPAQKWFDP
jgi:N-acetylglucosamine kinase-like BadF-type ATPase